MTILTGDIRQRPAPFQKLGGLRSGMAVATAVALTPLLVAAASAEASSGDFRPGEWTVVRDMHGSLGRKTYTAKVCVTAEQLRSDPAAPINLAADPRVASGPGRGIACTNSNFAMAGGRLSFASRCRQALGTAKGAWQGTYSPTGFTLSGKMGSGIISMEGTMTGRWRESCSG